MYERCHDIVSFAIWCVFGSTVNMSNPCRVIVVANKRSEMK